MSPGLPPPKPFLFPRVTSTTLGINHHQDPNTSFLKHRHPSNTHFQPHFNRSTPYISKHQNHTTPHQLQTPHHNQQNHPQPKPTYFSKWNKKSIQAAVENNQVTSVYVENLPFKWTTSDILSVLTKYGEIIDIYIPVKKARSGKRFGFIRFRLCEDASKFIDCINSVPVEDGTLQARIARGRAFNNGERRQPTQFPPPISNPASKGKSFAQTVSGPSQIGKDVGTAVCHGVSSLAFNSSKEGLAWLSSSAFGVLAQSMGRDDVMKIFLSKGIRDINISDVGEDAMLVQFPTKEMHDHFLVQELEWIRDVFQIFRAWQPGDVASKRKCWLQVIGIPLQAWCPDFFANMAMRFGQLIELADVTAKR